MKFRVRTMFYFVTVVAVISYALTPHPYICLYEPKIHPNASTGYDEFECKLVNRGLLPVYIRSYKDYSHEMTVMRPERIDERTEFGNGWTNDYDFLVGPKLKSPEWKRLFPGDSIQMMKLYIPNHSDRRVKIQLELTDWIGRRFEIQSREMKHDTSGTIEEVAGRSPIPMKSLPRSDRFKFLD